MSIIKPPVLPKAAGENFAEYDVRHLTTGDAMDNTTISRTTRQLAERDNALAATLTEVVSAVNNKEQYVNLPTTRLTLPALASEVITNYRIPPGFEARVLNGAVSSSPAGQGKLEVLYSENFGGVTGDIILTTMTEATADTKFYPEGDLIVRVTNIGSASAEIVSSLILTMRPVSDPEGAIIGAGIVGPPGEQGIKGDTGGKGDDGGVGPAGPKGLNWRGSYNIATPYFKDDGVNYAFPAYGTWSFIATQDNTGTVPLMSGVDPWNILVSAGTSPTGATGPAGLSPQFFSSTVFGTVFTQGDYVAGASNDGGYTAMPAGTRTFSVSELRASGGAVSPTGIAHITSHQQLKYKGTITVKLPSIAWGAAVDYTLPYAVIDTASTGSVLVNKLFPSAFDVNVGNSVPQKVDLGIVGIQPIT